MNHGLWAVRTTGVHDLLQLCGELHDFGIEGELLDLALVQRRIGLLKFGQ